MGYDFVNGYKVNPTGEQTVANYVWDTGSLQWVVQTSSGGAGPSSDVNVTNASLAVTQSGTWTTGRTWTLNGSTDNVRSRIWNGTNDVAATQLNSVPVSTDYGLTTQSVIYGKTTAGGGAFVEVKVTPSGALTVDSTVTGSVAVTGTFWQATQPVSLASIPLATGAATETTLSAINTKTPALGQTTMAGSQPVVIASNQSAVPVSGTFWQATQPVSIASMPSTPVTGTFWQATQPVSLTSTTITGSVAVTGPLTDTQLRATAVPITKTKVALTASAPATASVGTSSAQVVASNASRKGLVLTNLSANTISFGIGATAVLNSGITLTPNGVWVMDDYTFAIGAINAIASVAASTLAIQELT